MRFSAVRFQLRPRATKYKERTWLKDHRQNTFISHQSETHSGAVGWDPGARPQRPVETPNLNGVKSYIPQLARLVFRLSPSAGQSASLRRYIDLELSEFADRNSCCVCYVRPDDEFSQGFTPPTVSAEYLDDSRQVVDLLDFNESEISRIVDLLNQQATAEVNSYRKKLTATQKPTIQGYSFSFMKDAKTLNLTEAPETRLADSWAVEIEEKYYRPDELEKVRFRQLPVDSERKEDPFGRFASADEKTNFKY
ncbi:unnamed protein product [Oikopleura dioica]|uniref:Uncharacterized protein n=1 Tax=Oikopleura dioica TaxID=34765 RepID=E4X0D5_OIKDI|nr:unnamed protein product [Oikopleura dioica]